MSKYELILEYDGDWEGVTDFAGEIVSEFSCPVIINEVSEDGNVINGLLDWEQKDDKVDTTG